LNDPLCSPFLVSIVNVSPLIVIDFGTCSSLSRSTALPPRSADFTTHLPCSFSASFLPSSFVSAPSRKTTHTTASSFFMRHLRERANRPLGNEKCLGTLNDRRRL